VSGSRCPTCAAAVRPGAPWCLLCHRDLRPAPVAGPAGLEPASMAVPALHEPAPLLPPVGEHPPATATAAVPAIPPARHAAPATGWPCTVCGTANPLDAPACATCGSGFLAGLRAAEEPALQLPVLGDVSRLPRTTRLALAAGAGLMLALLLTALVLLAGRLS